nr:hypothetical protein BaRGS_012427 [Batillaria attramentaria]
MANDKKKKKKIKKKLLLKRSSTGKTSVHFVFSPFPGPGSYFLVSDHCAQDDALKTLKESKTPNLHKVQGQAAIYASGQPSVNGLQKILKAFKDEGHENILVFNLREEPVLFMQKGGDFIPYSLRHQDKLRRLFYSNFSPLEADENEALGPEPSTPEPHQLQLTVEDQLMTATEVYNSHSFTKPKISFDRCYVAECHMNC